MAVEDDKERLLVSEADIIVIRKNSKGNKLIKNFAKTIAGILNNVRHNVKEHDHATVGEDFKSPKDSMDSLESFATSTCPVTSFAGWDKVVPYQDFISISDAKTGNGEDVVMIDVSALPQEKDFKKMYRGKEIYQDTMDAILRFTKIFVNSRVKSASFSMVVFSYHGSSIAPSAKLAKLFYNVLKECSGRMSNCTIINASLKLKVLIFARRVFKRSRFDKKINLASNMQSFLEAKDLPSSVFAY